MGPRTRNPTSSNSSAEKKKQFHRFPEPIERGLCTCTATAIIKRRTIIGPCRDFQPKLVSWLLNYLIYWAKAHRNEITLPTRLWVWMRRRRQSVYGRSRNRDRWNKRQKMFLIASWIERPERYDGSCLIIGLGDSVVSTRTPSWWVPLWLIFQLTDSLCWNHCTKCDCVNPLNVYFFYVHTRKHEWWNVAFVEMVEIGKHNLLGVWPARIPFEKIEKFFQEFHRKFVLGFPREFLHD